MSAYVDLHDHFKTTLGREVAGMLMGESLGWGTHRHVFAHATNKKLIVKVEDQCRSFANVREWDIWNAVKLTDLAKWFAPVVDISPSGLVLIMKRCEEARPQELPKRVPAFFTDLKAENWGIYEGRPVCLDYGLHLMLEEGMTSRMRAVKW